MLYRKQTVITIMILLCMVKSFGQVQNNGLNKIISNADSVVIVSHLLTYGPIIIREDGKKTKQKFLIRNGGLNKPIIKEYVKLNKIEIDTLISILNLSETNHERGEFKCFMPHHGIVIFNKKKVYYIDICFDCLNIAFSKDIPDDLYFSTNTWLKLKAFFKSKKMHYELNNDSAIDYNLHLNAK